MRSLLVYEHLTGGGLLAERLGTVDLSALAAEGAAMAQAVCTDLARIPGLSVTVLVDHRLEHLSFEGCQQSVIRQASDLLPKLLARATAADAVLVIAPELDGLLVRLLEQIEAAGGRLISPGSRLAKLGSFKHLALERWKQQGLPVPWGITIQPGEPCPLEVPLPAVVKPDDGAGSDRICVVQNLRALAAARDKISGPARIEELVLGTPASVALLCGPGRIESLVPCRQRLTNDGRLKYLGGSLPLAADLADRAVGLARRAVLALDGPAVGYLGVDLILGRTPDQDVILELNPRLTTSYVGLRRLCRENLAASMLAVAAGELVTLSWHPGRVDFDAAGRIQYRRA